MVLRGKATVVLLAVASLTASIAVAAPAAADAGDTVNASVPVGSLTPPNGRYYLAKLHPGETVTQKLHVGNPNNHPITAVLEAVDAATNSVTGVRYGTPGSPKARISRWVVVSSPQITLQPSEQRDVPFTVKVPADVKPGQYLAAVSASVGLDPDVLKGTKTPPRRGAAFAMALQLQRSIGVEVDVPGAWAPKLEVTGATATANPNGNGVALGVHMANNGNALAHGNGVIRVADTKTDFPFKIDTFVPGTAIVYPLNWTKAIVPGNHHIQVDLSYEGGRHTAWTGTIDIAGALQDQLEKSLHQVQAGGKKSGLNIWLILGIILLVAFVGGAIMMRRRGRRPTYPKYRAA